MFDPAALLDSAAAIMPLDLWALCAVIVLGMAHLSLSSVLSLGQLGPAYILSARDETREPSGYAGRIARAYRNFLESFAQFAAALFLVHASATHGEIAVIGAWTFFAGRLFYIPAYAFGPPGIRPLCWTVANTGIILILTDIFIR